MSSLSSLSFRRRPLSPSAGRTLVRSSRWRDYLRRARRNCNHSAAMAIYIDPSTLNVVISILGFFILAFGAISIKIKYGI